LSALSSAGFSVFILVMFLGVYLSVLGLPGAMLIFLDVLLYAMASGFTQTSWKVLLVLLILAVIAEAVDLLLGMTKAHKPPVLKKILWGTALGSIAGAVILTPIFLGLGSWIGFFIGGLAGFTASEALRLSKLKGPHATTFSSFLLMMGEKTLKGAFTITMIFVSLSNIYS